MVLYALQQASCEWVVGSWLVCGFVCGNMLPNARQKIQIVFFLIRIPLPNWVRASERALHFHILSSPVKIMKMILLVQWTIPAVCSIFGFFRISLTCEVCCGHNGRRANFRQLNKPLDTVYLFYRMTEVIRGFKHYIETIFVKTDGRGEGRKRRDCWEGKSNW